MHLPHPFTKDDVVIKDSGGKVLTDVRVVDRGGKTGVTVFFENKDKGVADGGTDEIKLTLKKPIEKKFGNSGYRNKAGTTGIPIEENKYDPVWTDDKGNTGGTKPKEKKEESDEETEDYFTDDEFLAEDEHFDGAGYEEGVEDEADFAAEPEPTPASRSVVLFSAALW